ncbi:hypothetical protein Tco_0442888 [Tanacetum coccineum]
MADENVPAPAPIRSDEQILPFAAWVPIGKSNFVLDLHKKQKNPIFQISVDILQNTKFIKALTASAIYIQQFWNTLAYEAKTGVYSFLLDETRLTLDVNLLREALEINTINQAYQFMSPPSGDAIMDFVNELWYTEAIRFVSRMAVNNLYQPWRAILSMINQCLTGKTYGYDRPRYPVLQMIWGIITSTNVDFAKLMWDKFVQAIQTFLTNKENLGSPTKKGRKDKPRVILYCRFTKLIICHLGRIHNIHQRSTSPFPLAEEDFRLGNLKFIPKGEVDEVFGMPIPNELISKNIKNAPYYNAYLEMVTKHDQKVAAKKEGKKKTASTKQPKSKSATEKSSKRAPAVKPKPTKEKPSKPSTAKPPKPKPAKPTPLQNTEKEAIRPLPVVEGKGKAIVTEEQAAQCLLALHTLKRRSTTDQFTFQRQTPGTEEASIRPSAQPHDDTSPNIVCDSLSSADAETGAGSDKTNSGGDTEVRLDPGETHKSRTPQEQVLIDEDQAGPDPGISRVALARQDPEPTHDEFMADLYPKVQESLKFPADEHVILEDPLSSTGTLSSMKNLEDAYAIGDQFINDKSTDDKPVKLNVETKVVSMVTLLIYQASSSVPPLLTPIIDLSLSKPASFTTQAPIFIATTSTITTTRLLPPPPQQQSRTNSELAAHVTALEQKFATFEQKSKNLDNTTQNLESRVFTLELRDLPHKIDEVVRENVKEAVQIALQAPLRDHFRDLPEADMKEMLH